MKVEMLMMINVCPFYHFKIDSILCILTILRQLHILTDSGKSHNPWNAEEEHDTPNVQHVANETAFDPTKFFANSSFCVCYLTLLWLLDLIEIKQFNPSLLQLYLFRWYICQYLFFDMWLVQLFHSGTRSDWRHMNYVAVIGQSRNGFVSQTPCTCSQFAETSAHFRLWGRWHTRRDCDSTWWCYLMSQHLCAPIKTARKIRRFDPQELF